MRLPAEHRRELQRLYELHHGQPLSDEDADALGMAVLDLFGHASELIARSRIREKSLGTSSAGQST